MRLYLPVIKQQKLSYALTTWLTKRNMSLAVDIMLGRGLNNEVHHQLQPKKTTVLGGNKAAKGLIHAVHY